MLSIEQAYPMRSHPRGVLHGRRIEPLLLSLRDHPCRRGPWVARHRMDSAITRWTVAPTGVRRA